MPPSLENVAIVDRQDRVVGAAPRHLMRSERLIHRASYILVFNDQGDLFIQKRTIDKDVYPGYWEVAAGGVVLAGENYEQSAAREIAEELGLTDVALHYRFQHYYEDQEIRVWGAVFTCQHNGPFHLQRSEIEEGRFVDLRTLDDLVRKKPFTPDGLEILVRLRDHKNGEDYDQAIPAWP